MKLAIGGSPCTEWSIAKVKGRETKPSGIGWELFQNYKIALEKFRPEYFLYENNKSMAEPIRDQITAELGVEPIGINSKRVSAQSRERLYWTNIPGVQQPEDRGIVLRDILESGVPMQEKSYTLKAQYYKNGIRGNQRGNTGRYRRLCRTGRICIQCKTRKTPHSSRPGHFEKFHNQIALPRSDKTD